MPDLFRSKSTAATELEQETLFIQGRSLTLPQSEWQTTLGRRNIGNQVSGMQGIISAFSICDRDRSWLALKSESGSTKERGFYEPLR